MPLTKTQKTILEALDVSAQAMLKSIEAR